MRGNAIRLRLFFNRAGLIHPSARLSALTIVPWTSCIRQEAYYSVAPLESIKKSPTAMTTASPPREIPTSGFKIIEDKYSVEEETLPWYDAKEFYPVRIGEVFESRYQVIGKLGFGSVSTVWLCRDLQKHEYVTLKVYIIGHRQALNEERVLNHIATVREGHETSRLVRGVLDHFEIKGAEGTHQCLIHEPLLMTLKRLEALQPLSESLVTKVVRNILQALHFLHTVADVVHTDIQASNVMLTITDQKVLKTYEDNEMAQPSPRQLSADRTIYASRHIPIPAAIGLFILCDFGDAQFGDAPYRGEVMPDLYRAPEILLGIPWDHKIDIWGLGMMLWGIVEGKEMFYDREPDREGSIKSHLTRLIGLIGPPPKDLVDKGVKSKEFFNDDGTFKYMQDVPDISLEAEEKFLEGEQKARFLSFIRKMLQWRPEDRPTADELFKEPVL